MSGTARRPPGWYDDATDATLLRYWDGSGWTPHTSQRAADGRPSADAELQVVEVERVPVGSHPLEGHSLESTRRLDGGASMRPPVASSPPEHTTVPTPTATAAAPVSSPAALPGGFGPSPRVWFVAAAGAITAAASLVVAFAALGVALGR
jgi:hypothetical protein